MNAEEKKPTIRPAQRARYRGYAITSDHTLIIYITGTEKAYAEFAPRVLGGEPIVTVYKYDNQGEEKSPVLSFGAGGIGNIIRYLPLVLAAARRRAFKERVGR